MDDLDLDDLGDINGALWYDQPEGPVGGSFVGVSELPPVVLPPELMAGAAGIATPLSVVSAGVDPAPIQLMGAPLPAQQQQEQPMEVQQPQQQPEQKQPPRRRRQPQQSVTPQQSSAQKAPEQLQQPQEIAAPAKRKGGRPPLNLTPEERAARRESQRARNKINQLRYRERQAAKQYDVVARHAAVEAEVARAREEQQHLRETQQILHKRLNIHNHAVRVLEAHSDGDGAGRRLEQGQPEQEEAARPHAAGYIVPHLEELPTSSTGSGATAMDEDAPPPPEVSPKAAGRSASSAKGAAAGSKGGGRVCLTAEEQLAAAMSGLATHRGASGGDGSSKDGGVCGPALRVGSQALEPALPLPPMATPETIAAAFCSEPNSLALPASTRVVQDAAAIKAHLESQPELLDRIRNQTPEDAIAEWHRFALAVRDVLTEHELTKHESVLGSRLRPVMLQRAVIGSLELRHRPDCARALLATSGQAAPGTWERVVAVVAPDASQRAMLHHLWKAYGAKVSRLRAEHSTAMEQVCAAASAVRTPESISGASLASIVGEYLTLVEGTGRLEAWKDLEFVALLQLTSAVGRCLTPLQKARAVVACYPHFPDTLYITALLAEEEELRRGGGGATTSDGGSVDEGGGDVRDGGAQAAASTSPATSPAHPRRRQPARQARPKKGQQQASTVVEEL